MMVVDFVEKFANNFDNFLLDCILRNEIKSPFVKQFRTNLQKNKTQRISCTFSVAIQLSRGKSPSGWIQLDGGGGDG